jgi:hypothetical protein
MRHYKSPWHYDINLLKAYPHPLPGRYGASQAAEEVVIASDARNQCGC